LRGIGGLSLVGFPGDRKNCIEKVKICPARPEIGGRAASG
jgi:hypothetical protein